MTEFKSKATADNVSRLKELLFDTENRHLSEMSSRLKALQQAQAEFEGRLGSLDSRLGDNARVRKAVADILDGAIADANAERHEQISNAVAPLVVGTVKTEIRNSKDELVEALYPMTGRMVKAYVADAMREMAENINRRLESNRFMLRLRSISSGRPMSELLMVSAAKPKIDQIFLIRRGSGAVLARWPEADEQANSDAVMGGVLTAINDFASEALHDSGGTLREIDLGEKRVYVRASPMFLLAAVSSGVATTGIEKIIDNQFLSVIDTLQEKMLPSGTVSQDAAKVTLGELDTTLDRTIADEHDRLVGEIGHAKPLRTLLWFIAVPLIAFACWLIFDNYKTERTRAIASQVLAGSSEFTGYPAQIDVGWLGQTVDVSGLAPSHFSRSSLASKLRVALPGVDVKVERLGVVPAGEDRLDEIEGLRHEIKKVGPELSKIDVRISQLGEHFTVALLRRALQRSRRDVELIKLELPRLSADTAADANAKAIVARLRETVKASERKLDAMTKAASQPTATRKSLSALVPSLEDLRTQFLRRAAEMSALLIDPNQPQALAPPQGIGTGDDDLARSADFMATASDHLATITVAVAQLAAIRGKLVKPVVQKTELTPRQQLEDYVSRHAVFFSNGVAYRDGRDTKKVLDGLADLMRKSKATVRVVGYTDEMGNDDRNTPLSEQRARKVLQALSRRGVPAGQLILLGRKDARDISAATGAASPNRRVEFEVAFDNEIRR